MPLDLDLRGGHSPHCLFSCFIPIGGYDLAVVFSAHTCTEHLILTDYFCSSDIFSFGWAAFL